MFLLPLVLGAMGAGFGRLGVGSDGDRQSLAALLALMLVLVAGPLVDWKGSRPLIVTGGLVAALGFLILSTFSGLWVVLTGRCLAALGVGLASGVAIQVLVAHWFVQYRGTFLGLAVVGAGLGSRFGAALVDEDSWRIAARVLALGGMGVALAGYTIIHSYPAREEADDPTKVRVPGRRSPQLERMIPASQYVRTLGLWRALGFLGLASAGVVWVRSGLVFGTPLWFLIEGSADASTPGLTGASFGMGSAFGGLVWGMAADFWLRNRLFWLSGSGAVALLVLLSFFSSTGGLGALLFLAGLFLGGLGFLIGLTFVDYMGVKLLGTLGLVFGLFAGLGTAARPVVWTLFLSGWNYEVWFLVSVPVVVLAVLSATKAPYPVVELERQTPTV